MAIGNAIVPRAERDDGGENVGRRRDPARAARLCLGGADPPASASFVHVSPRQRLELSDAHPRRVADEEREPIAGGDESVDGEDVLSGRRGKLALLLAGELHASVPRGVRLDAVMVEDHREDGDGLPSGKTPLKGVVSVAFPDFRTRKLPWPLRGGRD
jgi:hypothetical protein